MTCPSTASFADVTLICDLPEEHRQRDSLLFMHDHHDPIQRIYWQVVIRLGDNPDDIQAVRDMGVQL